MYKNSSWSIFETDKFIWSIFETRIPTWLIVDWRDRFTELLFFNLLNILKVTFSTSSFAPFVTKRVGAEGLNLSSYYLSSPDLT